MTGFKTLNNLKSPEWWVVVREGGEMPIYNWCLHTIKSLTKEILLFKIHASFKNYLFSFLVKVLDVLFSWDQLYKLHICIIAH